MNAPSNPNSNSPATGLTGPEMPLPPMNKLINATGIALAIACVLLVFVVFPAEYNIDPTGFGKTIGLTKLAAPAPGNVTPLEDTSASGDDASESAADGEAVDHDNKNDSVVIDVPAGRGLEYKFFLKTGQRMVYDWKIMVNEDESNPGPETLIYDFHGEPEGDTTGFYESYSVSNASAAKGTFTAPFTGIHGWYWNNTSKSSAKIILITSGEYEVLGLR